MKTRYAIGYALFTLASLSGCGNDFDPGSRVTDLRVLAVRADAPYAAPGATVHLDALAHDPAARPLTWGWGVCVDPPSASVTDCIDAMDRSSFTVARDKTTFDVALPADALSRLPAAARSGATLGVVVVACPGDLSTAVRPTSIAATGELPFTCTDASGRALSTAEYVTGMKRIFERESDTNANPLIDHVTWDGADWPSDEVREVDFCDTQGNAYADCKGVAHKVAPIVTADSVEAGVDSFGQAFREQLVVEYYATEGIFENDARIASQPEVGWAARRAAAGSTLTMWLVVHDDRGGVTWETRQVHVKGAT